MERLVELLEKNWSVVSQAPLAFLLLGVVAFGLAYAAAAWKFSAQIEQVKSASDTLRERLQLKTEQADSYRERALKYDDKLLVVAQTDSAGLREKTLMFVGEIRAFMERHRHKDDLIQGSEWVEMTQARDEEEKQRLWHKFTSAMSRAGSERMSEWERRFKVEALMLRDELLSRLPDQPRPERADFNYEHPVNYFGYCEVADDLERMAKQLLRASA
ncbi:Chromosome partitioning protein ParA [Rhodanobacter sp. Root179]|uniref:hypothetical protein n=1 Tax=Rhodanobacter sp. Root179 TaxID=1736482 RepID=UPI0006F4962A|nr:hypothetical protein [Rhodanobacter sp. Root179]KRB60004.1 hypothetical protein ASD82_00225 [Rhodanobacter sp. Root179]